MSDTTVSRGSSPLLVSAEAHSDDWAIQVYFDAAPYLKDISQDELDELIECGWGGDYPGDYVAYAAESWEGRLSQLFDYLKLADTGFECHLDREGALAWLREHRTDLTIKEEATRG